MDFKVTATKLYALKIYEYKLNFIWMKCLK